MFRTTANRNDLPGPDLCLGTGIIPLEILGPGGGKPT